MPEINAVTSDWTQNIGLNDTTTINFKLDTTAQANIIRKTLLLTFYKLQLKSYTSSNSKVK